jgi:hypothetical protein
MNSTAGVKAKFTLRKSIGQEAALRDRVNTTERARLTWSSRQVRRVPVALRKYRTDAAIAASETEAAQAYSPAYWVCLALLLATVALAVRIASLW